jgi:tetratricopeptide (TPR) repeat protein
MAAASPSSGRTSRTRARHGAYPESVFSTFTLALDDIVNGAEDRAPCDEAETVLGVMAHLAPEQIPVFLLAGLAAGKHAVMAEAGLDRALEELAQAGLAAWGEFEDGAAHLGVHRLVQEVMRARLGDEQTEVAALTTRLVQSTYDHSESFEGHFRNIRWLPQAKALLDFAPRRGPAAWHTLWTLFQIGDMEVQRGSQERALTAYRQGRELAEAISTADPGNAGWQRDLSVSHEKIGDVLVDQGNLPAALDAYKAALAIAERLATSDPGNAGWQRDLSVSHSKIGDVLVDQGNLPAALDAYKAALAIAERLATSDPGNAGWQRDLSVSHSKIGGVPVDQGNLPAALDAYKAALAIAERLATSDPGNAGWQRDLAVSNERIGDISVRQGNNADARTAFENALAAYETLIRRNPGDVPSMVNSVVPRWRLGSLDPNNGRKHLQAALDILNPLAAANRLDANRVKWIPRIEAELAALTR